MRFQAIDHIALNVDDVDRALAFYHEALGLDIERIDEFRAGKVGFPSVRVTPQTVIDLMPGGKVIRDGRYPLNHFALTLVADDLVGLRAGDGDPVGSTHGRQKRSPVQTQNGGRLHRDGFSRTDVPGRSHQGLGKSGRYGESGVDRDQQSGSDPPPAKTACGSRGPLSKDHPDD